MDASERDSGKWMDAQCLLWPFLNSSGCWWLISSIFLIRISCHKTTRANGYYGAWPGWVVSISVLPLTHPWNFPGKSTGVGCHFLCQGISPTQGSNPGLPHYRQTLYPLSHHYWHLVGGDPDAAKCPTVHRMPQQQRMTQSKMSVMLSLRNLCVGPLQGLNSLLRMARGKPWWDFTLERDTIKFMF